jgi:dipeptidyl aminopeptidase/acylaminoacyl peptidase
MVTRIFLLALIALPFYSSAQKKAMTSDVYNQWTRITDTEISKTGEWIIYSLKTEVGNTSTHLYNTRSGNQMAFERSESPTFDATSKYLIFWKKPDYEAVRQLKLKKTKKDDLPKDSIVVFNLSTNSTTVFTDVDKMSTPEKWGNHLFLHLDEAEVKKDSTAKKPIKNESKENGTKLLIVNLYNMNIDTLQYVLSFATAEENPGLAYVGTGLDSTSTATVYHYNLISGESTALTDTDGKFSRMAFSEDARHLAFIADLDTTDNKIRPNMVMLAKNMEKAKTIAQQNSPFIKNGFMISDDRTPRFSKDNSRLFFGIAAIPLLPDTTLLDEEKPVVEVWNTNDPRLYTQQEVQLNRDKNKNYLSVYHLNTNSNVSLANPEIPDIELSQDGIEPIIIATSEENYLKEVTWEGSTNTDLYTIDPNTGSKTLVAEAIPGNVNNSPQSTYAYWFNRENQTYYTYHLSSGVTNNISKEITTPLADELNDRPMDPSSYGIAGWTTGDRYILVYDRYDIWKVDPRVASKPINLTNGRTNKISYRFIDLDREEEAIDLSQDLILYVFDENDKTSGYARLSPNGQLTTIFKDKYSYSRRIWKAENSNDIVYTKENFDVFPDLIHSTLTFASAKKVSNANPQQSEYKWGQGELYSWKDDFGNEHTGMLFTPEGFDPSKKYPMLVNFYERSSDGIYRHRAPYANRSTINYTYYMSKGYVIFNPDVFYQIGYPGQGAYIAAVSGTKSLIEKGFIDPKRIALQGHSWGGYQIAHILTKTDMFACAESGAPVVNMISAYGGIRWGSGMSRMFQYEKTQSRLGKTLWENPTLYIENSPIFEMDKTNTPVLILHNDADTAVPWYQGIEYFVALRRLNKPAWLLNYNDEPHWPLKWPNRLDFNKRMEQFFDHYLMGKEMPEWMKRGVPALEKESNLGY